jgi:HEAT repeat protein
MRYIVLFIVLLFPLQMVGQSAATEPLDPLNFPRLKNFSAYRSSSNNIYVDSNDDCKHPIAGETIVLADLKGPGIVTHIWVTVADNEYGWPRLARVRVYYDGHKTPSVDAPLGDFFGVGHGYERDLNSLMVRNASFGRARNCYWPMPFRKSIKITLTNEGTRRITSLYYHVDWQKHASLPEDVGYFHAYYRQATPPPVGKNYTILDVRGAGHYVGTVLNIIQTQIGWFGEGDDYFYVDGEKAPRIEGTGSEDYFNDAWGLRVSDGPWTGIPVAEGEGVGARLTGYRWHVPDPVPFTKSLRVEIEHAGWTYNANGTARSGFEERPDHFSSVAFWYQKGVNEDLPEPPYGYARLPFGNAEQIEVENSVKDVTVEKGEASVQKEVFWSKDLLFFKAQAKGAKMNVPIDVPRDGRYEVVAQVAQSPDYGDYVVTLDGKLTNSTTLTWGPLDVLPPDVEVLHNYQPETYVAVDRRLGWHDLTKGRHIITFTCVGKDPLSSGYNLGVDDVVLAEVINQAAESPAQNPPAGAAAEVGTATAAVYRGQPLDYYRGKLRRASGDNRAAVIRSIGAFGNDAAPATKELAALLPDSDPEVRSAAAWALSQVGAKAGSVAPEVAKLLQDPDPQVRGFAALALREMGRGAAVTIPELSAALQDPAPSVRMTAASALGSMGAAASPAVPALVAELEASNGLEISNDDVQVIRNLCYALGDIGPSARSAIPAIQKVQHLRIRYIAQEAIAKIEGNPSPTWH